jgi:hypothetical protein
MCSPKKVCMYGSGGEFHRRTISVYSVLSTYLNVFISVLYSVKVKVLMFVKIIESKFKITKLLIH